MSVPPSVQAWTDETWKWGARSALPPDVAHVLALGDALRAEVLRLTEELAATKNSADFYRDLDNERSGKVRSLRAENLRLREALERVLKVFDPWGESECEIGEAARAVLGSVSSEPPRWINAPQPPSVMSAVRAQEDENEGSGGASSEPPEEAER